MTPVLVLDVESRLSREAVALLPNGDAATIDRRFLQEVAAVSLLSFREGDDGLADCRLVSALSDEEGEESVLGMVDAALADLGGEGVLVTHNGVQHDMPLLRRRCLSRWAFGCAAIAGWAEMGRDRHVDTLLRCGAGGYRGPALVDICATLGVPPGLPAASRGAPIHALVRKGQADVAATALAHLHLQALGRRDARWLARCWSQLAAYLMTPEVRGDHLTPIARRGLEVAATVGV